MKAFVFDTETTGLPVRDGALSEQPYVVQFAGILHQTDHAPAGGHLNAEDVQNLAHCFAQIQ